MSSHVDLETLNEWKYRFIYIITLFRKTQTFLALNILSSRLFLHIHHLHCDFTVKEVVRSIHWRQKKTTRQQYFQQFTVTIMFNWPISSQFSFLILLKTSENQTFSDVFRGSKDNIGVNAIKTGLYICISIFRQIIFITALWKKI